MEDWDEEVVADNSELYTVLKEAHFDDFIASSKTEDRSEGTTSVLLNKSISKASREVLFYLDLILNSQLLLDEDVSYLYGYSTDLFTDKKPSLVSQLLTCGIFGSVFLTTVIVCNGVLSLSEIEFGYRGLKQILDRTKRRNILTNLINILKKTNHCIRKTVIALQEQESYLRMAELRSKSRRIIDDYEFLERRKRVETYALACVLGECMVDHINISRNATQALIKNLPLVEPVDSKNNYISFSSDIQPRIDQFFTCKQSLYLPSSTGSALDVLKNIYLLMESEFLRRLGLCFCPHLWLHGDPLKQFENIFVVIQIYKRKCEDIFDILNFYYSKHIFPEFPTTNKALQKNGIESYSVIHKLCTVVNHTLHNARFLEERLEALEVNDCKNIDYILGKLEELKLDMNSCFQQLEVARKFFIKLNKVNEPLPEENKSLKKEVQQVSYYKDKSSEPMIAVDRVYFGITEGRETEDFDFQVEENITPSIPPLLMTELKTALIGKKNEFQERETDAVGNDPNYQQFLKMEDPLVIQENKEKYLDSFHFQDSQFQLQKDIVSNAILKSFDFKKMEEDFFGSDEEIDDS